LSPFYFLKCELLAKKLHGSPTPSKYFPVCKSVNEKPMLTLSSHSLVLEERRKALLSVGGHVLIHDEVRGEECHGNRVLSLCIDDEFAWCLRLCSYGMQVGAATYMKSTVFTFQCVNQKPDLN
jgi:hypothetical protein